MNARSEGNGWQSIVASIHTNADVMITAVRYCGVSYTHRLLFPITDYAVQYFQSGTAEVVDVVLGNGLSGLCISCIMHHTIPRNFPMSMEQAHLSYHSRLSNPSPAMVAWSYKIAMCRACRRSGWYIL